MEESEGEPAMIPFDFEYYRPDTINSAVQTFIALDQQGKDPRYYGGGTEIISMGRMANLSTGAVIDIKNIPECRILEIKNDCLLIGAGVTLTQIHESGFFPLLGCAGARVADRTIQNKITLGGNLCGTIIYREAALPLLLADSEVITIGPQGIKIQPINKLFHQKLQLEKGELVVQIRVSQPFLSYPHFHIKRTRQDKIHYPLVTICAMQVAQQIRIAFSGLCDFPFRSLEVEAEINKTSLPVEKRIDKAIAAIPQPIADNLEGSSGYRKFVLGNLLTNIIHTMEE
ncbi:MAG: FAD binding domain-containing protein [Methylocystaceae bacterium]